MTSQSIDNARNRLAASSLVLGILSSVPLAGAALLGVTGNSTLFGLSNLTMLFVGMEVIAAITAIITGIVSLKREGQNSLAVVGIALGTLTIASIVLVIWVIAEAFSNFSIQ